MGDGFRQHLGGPTRSTDREYGSDKSLFVPWDISKMPANNSDRVAKLGFGDTTRAMAFIGFDKKALWAQLADGHTGKPKWSALVFTEPDNWVFRPHEGNGGNDGVDNVLALRLIVDHSNFSDKRKQRSTIWVDQCNDQTWAWAMDAFWVKNLQASVADSELDFDKASFLRGLYSADVATKITRSALMFNIAKNAGFITDGEDAAQWWHTHHISEVPASTPPPAPSDPFSGAASGNQTVTEEPGTPGSTTAQEGGDGCSKVKRKQGTARGDMPFDVKGKIAALAYDEAYETEGELFSGKHWIHTPAPRPPLKELKLDPKSNQPVLPRNIPYGIWVYVKIPRYPNVPTYNDRPTTTVFPGIPVPTGTPTSVPVGTVYTERYPTGVATGTGGVITIPEEIPAGFKLIVDIEFLTPAAGFTPGPGAEVNLVYCVIARGANAAPVVATGTVVAILDSVTYPIAGGPTLYRILAAIPESDILGAEGGKVAFAVVRRGDRDGNPDAVDIVAKFTFFARTEIIA